MLLGQLYYYSKKIDEIILPINKEKIDEIDILGIPKLKFEDVLGLNENQLKLKIRDTFSDFYLKVLEANNLNFAVTFWQELTSPKISNSLALNPTTNYQEYLLNWIVQGADINNLANLVTIGQLSTEQEDFALYYGLKVMYKFSEPTETSLTDQLSLGFATDEVSTSKLSKEPQILVLTNHLYSPLFANLNCLTDVLGEDLSTNLKNILTVLKKYSSIKLIILEGQELQDMTIQIKKKVPTEILVTSFNLNAEEDQKSTYFDNLVKKTLGVRLP